MQYNAIVTNIKDITPEIKLFFVKLKDNSKFNFKAGQFAVLGLPDDRKNIEGLWHRRAYSIASSPSQDKVEFYIALVSDGKLTPRLFDLKVGDDIFMSPKAAGVMNFDNVKEDADLLFISTGTGIAPFVSIIREHREEILNGKRQIALVHGARHTYELGFKGELEELAKSCPYFHYYPIVSRSEQEIGRIWEGYKGHAQSLVTGGVIEKDFGKKITSNGFHTFLCGNARMVEETVEIFVEKGFKRNTPNEKGNLYFDKH